MSKKDCSLDKSSFEGFFGRIEDNTHSERDGPLMTSCAYIDWLCLERIKLGLKGKRPM